MQDSLSAVIVVAFVFGALAAVAARLIINRRKEKTPCGCGRGVEARHRGGLTGKSAQR
ncbi:hypothetical protein [Treponema endosymbiont of Eucomonympha sp.]|uniref:hypothetical protein n=1 Tax=Treponema endosymbiont of Eucomonympha sp. TaxID=1580831 RepID=UPI000ADC9C81|nr:hypothetical protein [Treponema endosymbiont of Eucomonympha sp.]